MMPIMLFFLWNSTGTGTSDGSSPLGQSCGCWYMSTNVSRLESGRNGSVPPMSRRVQVDTEFIRVGFTFETQTFPSMLWNSYKASQKIPDMLQICPGIVGEVP